VLLGLTGAGYLAGRLFSEEMPAAIFLAVTSLTAAIGAIATAVATIEQLHERHGKPGRFDAAPAEFLISSAFLLFALISRKTARRDWIGWGVLLAAAAVVFGAAEVRFAFVAIFATLTLASIAGVGALPRKAIVAILGVLVIGVVAGLAMRPAMSATFLREILAPGDCFNFDSSISMRKVLFSEALHLIPEAGFFGLGLDWFMKRSCIMDGEIHNTVLQAFVEFGWIGGVAFMALLVTAVASAWSAAGKGYFVFRLLGLCFTILMAMMHGRLTADAALMFFIGYGARSDVDPRAVNGSS
jgi:O-antigen ligase